MLFRSLNRGDTWEEISPDLTTNDPAKIGLNVPYCTITSISESPLKAGTIWVGTDDGKVQLTQNHGGALDRPDAGAGGGRRAGRSLGQPRVRVAARRGTAFVSKSGFRNDDFAPYLYKTTDCGKTWTAIAGNLPNAPINVVVQDRREPRSARRRQRRRRVRVDRRRRALDAAQGQSAGRSPSTI